VKRSLLSLLLALGALVACKEPPPGQLEPIPRPPGFEAPAKTETPKAAAAPAVDPNKVVLRWKLAKGAPAAFRLDGNPEGSGGALKTVYVLEHPQAGDNIVRLAQEGAKGPEDQGTFSERGFILDGLGELHRNLATLLLELPKDPVGQGDTWALGADLVDTDTLGREFNSKKSERRNTVKLASLSGEGDDRVATLEYDLFERVSGTLPIGTKGATGPATETEALKPAPDKNKGKKGKKAPEPVKTKGPSEATFEVSFTGRGEFLVNTGRWRSWQGTLSTKSEGYTPPTPEKNALRVPAGTYKLKLTALDSVPASLQQPEAKK
jgi:hypothetical protein